MNKPLSHDVLQHTMDVLQKHGGNLSTACVELNINRSSLQGRVRAAKQQGIVAGAPNPNEPAQLLSQIRRLQEDLKKAQQERLDHGMIKHKIIQLNREVNEIKPPSWLVKSDSSHSKPGVPTLFLSDLHWGEVVDGKQINNVNRYDMEIARTRLQYVAERAVHLCEIISPKLEYPGIVIPLGGDMISGNIHDELMATNEMNSMPTILDLFEALTQLIKFFRNKFEKIFLPCVTGNHGRETHKIWAKDRHHTSFDWLLYCFLAKRFADDKNVTFLIPDGTDAYYQIYGHSYLLTHGDQFRGGDGVIGPLGPIIRGDHRKRSRNMQINMAYDTMLIGHWHQYIQLQRLIVNGCFPTGSPVTMEDGTTKPIETIEIGERVITQQGNVKSVVDVYSRTNADRLVGLRCGTKSSELRLTPNHKVWAIKGSSVEHSISCNGSWKRTLHDPTPGWVEAKYLSVDDYIHIPSSNHVEDRPDVSLEFCRLLGFYLAEGSSSGKHGKLYHADFTLHRNEEMYANFIHQECVKAFGKARHHLSEKRPTARTVVVDSKSAAERLVYLCGRGAGSKRLHSSLMLLPIKKQRELLLGWLSGDGHTTRHGRFKQGIVVSGTTISRTLIEQLRMIALRCGYFASINTLRAGGPRKHDAFTLLFTGETARSIAKELNEYIPDVHDCKRTRPNDFKVIEYAGNFFVRISDVWIEENTQPVFNLTVEDDHTYIVNGVGVANSLKGYDEYAYGNNFPYEPPQQALWLTHPKYRITYRMPVLADKFLSIKPKSWVSF